MRGKWGKGGLIKRFLPENLQFFVVGISDQETLIHLGRCDDLESDRHLADQNTSERLTCYVYSDDNRVLYSTEK